MDKMVEEAKRKGFLVNEKQEKEFRNFMNSHAGLLIKNESHKAGYEKGRREALEDVEKLFFKEYVKSPLRTLSYEAWKALKAKKEG